MSSERPIKTVAILGTRGIPAKYGGFETFAEEIAKRLVQRGISVTVFCESHANRERPKRYLDVHLEYVSAPKLGPFTTILYDLFCLLRARKGYDVVYMLGYGASLFCFIPRLFGSAVWINMDGLEWARTKWSWPARIYLKFMERIAMWTPSRIIADADAIKSNLSARYRMLPPCSTIPYGAEIIEAEAAPSTHFLTEWQIKPNEYYLVVCRLEPENHILEIIRGYVASPSTFPLIIVGDRETATRYVQELLAIQDPRVRFVGTVFDKAKLQALRYHCFAYFHGHSVGGTNPSLLEALGCGNPVIAHDNPFNREVAENAGLYFSGPSVIPELINKTESDSAMRKQMSTRAREIVASRYTWERITQAYFDELS